jgi:hypothetical protein
LLGCAVHVAVTPAKLDGENAARFFGRLLFNSRSLPVKPELLAQRLISSEHQKGRRRAHHGVRVVFVAADDSQALMTAEMRELISEALDLLADKS